MPGVRPPTLTLHMHSPPSNSPQSPNSTPAAWGALPAGIWALGFGSLFMDVSSELIHSLLPVFMVSALGASLVTVGIIEGVAEATAAVMKVFSGTLSDYLGKRKFLMVLGYALAAFTKPIFPLATSLGWVFTARFVDRIGKGIRGAPRDALVADITPPQLRGAAYGLRQALDSVGALVGPLLAVAFMIWFADDIRAVMWVAAVPAFIAVALLMIYVREPESAYAHGPARAPLTVADAKRLPLRYWLVVLVGAVFTLARCRARTRLRTDCDDRDERLLRRSRLSSRVRRRPRQPAHIVVPRVGSADRRGFCACLCRIAAVCVRGCCAVGLTHGLYARPVVETCRGHCSRRAARHGFRDIQSCEWRRATVGECYCGRSMELGRAVGHVPGRCSLRGHGGHRVAGLHTAPQATIHEMIE